MKKRWLQHRKNQNGFTLVELLVSIAVIGIAVIGIASLFYNIQYTQRQARFTDAATREAQRQIETLRNNGYNSLEDGQTIDFTSEIPTSILPNPTGTTTVSETSPGVKRVDVVVSYTDDTSTKQVKLSSLIGVIGLSQ